VSARLVLLGKPGCHLCHEMEVVAAGVAAARGLGLETADVRSRAEWTRYLLEIPVLLLDDGREVVRHRATADDLAARLDSLLR
jgi:hypothetical protein